MLSGIPASLSVTSPSSLTGLGENVVTRDHRGGEMCLLFRPDTWGQQHCFPPLVFYVPLTSDAPGVKESSLQAGKWSSSCSQGLRLPSVGCLVDAAAWLDGRGRLQKKSFLLSLRPIEGLTQLDSRCHHRSDAWETRVPLSCRIVDVIVNRVLPREVAQAVKGSNDTRFYGVGRVV